MQSGSPQMAYLVSKASCQPIGVRERERERDRQRDIEAERQIGVTPKKPIDLLVAVCLVR